MARPQADRIFKTAFKRHFANHEANFPPSRNLSLGDYGTFSNGYFTRLGNISDAPFGIKFKMLRDKVSNSEEFQSAGDVSINSIAKGSVFKGTVALKAAVEFDFSSKSALYFSSAAVQYHQIDNLYDVGREIVKQYRRGKWDRKFVVITRLIQGTNTVIIISGSNKSSLKLEAASPTLKSLKLGDAKAKFDIVSSNKVSYKSVADGLSPIGFGLSKVYNPIFHLPGFGSFPRKGSRVQAPEPEREELVFGDVVTYPTELPV
jgi:hypothetical protein